MKMLNKRVTTGLLAGAAAITTVLAMTSPAQATDPYTPGGGPAANFTASNVTFEDVDAGALLECEQVDLNGSIENAGTPRAHSVRAGVLDDIAATNCVNDTFGATDITLQGSWDVVVTGDPASPTSTVWPVELRNVSADVSAVGCSFTAEGLSNSSGVISGNFNTATQEFTVTSDNLHVNDPVGTCFLIGVADGNDVQVAGTWTNIATPGFTLTH